MGERTSISGSVLALTVTLTTNILAKGALATSTIVQTKNFIDTISGYHELSTCAELVLSTVVRGEFSGCEDAYAITSYSCFCTDSSSYMSQVISSDVMASCPASVASVQASSALGVFSGYCELGIPAGLATTVASGDAASSTTTASATPAGTTAPATATVTVTNLPSNSDSTAGSSGSSGLSSTSVAIVIGVLVSFFGIVIVLAAWFIWRKYKAIKLARAWPDEIHGGDAGGGPPVTYPAAGGVAEAPAYQKFSGMSATTRPAEVLTTEGPVEVAAHSDFVELPAGAVRQDDNLHWSSR